MRFYAEQKISAKRSISPEGFLIIEDVPIARTGTQLYGPDETPVKTGPEGFVKIDRDADEVFREETVASVNGKPLVDNHPPSDVTIDNWRQLTRGIVMNARRGKGAFDDLLLADIMVTDKDAIDAINQGKTELSCGYDADYEEIEPGHGRQKNIIMNHLALVDSGRCGPRCAIGDHAKKEKTMAERKGLKRVLDRIRRAAKDNDPDKLEEAVKDAEEEMEKEEGKDKARDEDVPEWFKKHVEENNARFEKLEAMIQGSKDKARDDDEPAKEEEKDKPKDKARDDDEPKKDDEEKKTDDEDEEEEKEKKTADSIAKELPQGSLIDVRKVKDSAPLADSFQETVALAEILVPGIKIPTFDSKAAPKASFDTICNLRRTALDLAYVQPDTRAIIDDVLGNGRTLDTKTMDCDSLRSVFLAAGAVKRRQNNATNDDGRVQPGAGGGLGVKSAIRTLADLNKRHQEFYSK